MQFSNRKYRCIRKLGCGRWGRDGGRRRLWIYLYRIVLAEHEFEAIHFAVVYWVGVHDADIHEPGFEIIGFDEGDARGSLGAKLGHG